MRHETHRWNDVTATSEVVSAGVGQTGLTPTVAVQRLDTGHFLASGGASWAVGFATNSMTAVDGTNLPGLYEYAVPSARLTEVGVGNSGFLLKIVETNNAQLEYVKIEIEESLTEEVSGRAIRSMVDSIFKFLISTEDDAQIEYISDTGSGTGKFYPVATNPAVGRSAEYVDRIAVLRDTSSGNGEIYTPVRIGGIFNDGGGDYFLLQHRDGTTYTGTLGVGDRLLVGNSYIVAHVAGYDADVIDSTALATSAVDEISDGVWEELLAGHLGADKAAQRLTDASNKPSAGTIADQVWDETMSDHVTALSTGEALDNAGGLTAGDIADAVWDESAAAHLGVGSTGEALDDASSTGSTPSDIADAVWDEDRATHVAAGSFGLIMQVVGGMVQANHRLKNPIYDPDGRMLTADLVVYPTGAAADADTTPLATFGVTMTYDGDGNLASLLSSE